MNRKKRKHKRQPTVIINLQQQRRKARRLGYENIEDYETGLSVVSRLLAQKKTGESDAGIQRDGLRDCSGTGEDPC